MRILHNSLPLHVFLSTREVQIAAKIKQSQRTRQLCKLLSIFFGILFASLPQLDVHDKAMHVHANSWRQQTNVRMSRSLPVHERLGWESIPRSLDSLGSHRSNFLTKLLWRHRVFCHRRKKLSSRENAKNKYFRFTKRHCLGFAERKSLFAGQHMSDNKLNTGAIHLSNRLELRLRKRNLPFLLS